MTDASDDTNSPPHRRTFEASGDDVEVRAPDDESGVFELRMPIASTGEVRNQGDDPLTRDEVDGMARQINDGSLTVGVFVDHGQTNISGRSRYSIAERVGEWQEAEITTRDGSDAELLEATARMMDPDSLPDIPVRGHLGTVKELAVRDMAVPASIGWGDDDSAPGGVDLMEASVVGIQADKRTHSEASAGEVVARAAVSVGADPDALVREVEAAIGTHNLDDPEFAESDPVEWSSNDTTVRGRVADIGDEFSPAEGVTITGEEGEAVYLIHELDDELEPPQYRRENVAKPESSLNESQADLPPLEGNFADKENEMTNEPESGEESDTDREAPDLRDMEEDMREMKQQMEENTRLCREMHQQMMPDDENAGDDGMDEDEDEDEDEDDEQSVDADDDATGDDRDADELREELEDLRKQLDAVREGGVTGDDVDVPGDDVDDEQRDTDEQTDDSGEDAVKSLLK